MINAEPQPASSQRMYLNRRSDEMLYQITNPSPNFFVVFFPVLYPCCFHSWATSFRIWTSWPGLKAGRPIYGHPSHRKASPSAQLPQEPVLPWTVKSNSSKSSDCSIITFSSLSALARRSVSSASSRSASPHVQSLQARRLRPVLGWHSGAGRLLESSMNKYRSSK